MSYARWGWGSDVYVFFSTDNCLECCACNLIPEDVLLGPTATSTFRAFSTGDMVKHLWEHQNNGDEVPEDTFDYLWLDNEENFGNNKALLK
jgi:hypothetical protein